MLLRIWGWILDKAGLSRASVLATALRDADYWCDRFHTSEKGVAGFAERSADLEREVKHLHNRWRTQAYCVGGKRILASSGLVALFFSKADQIGFPPTVPAFGRFLGKLAILGINPSPVRIPLTAKDLYCVDPSVPVSFTTLDIPHAKLSDGTVVFHTAEEAYMFRFSLNILAFDLISCTEVTITKESKDA